FRASVFQSNFRATVGFLNHSNDCACSSQNLSGSRMERSYKAPYCAELMNARFTTSGDGGNVRPSCCSDSVEMVWFDIGLVKLIPFISSKLFARVNSPGK